MGACIKTPAAYLPVVEPRDRTESNRPRQWSIEKVKGPEYDPIKKMVTAQLFIAKAKRLQRAYNWSEEILLIAAQHQLKGAFKKWGDAQQVFMTWSGFSQAFAQDFPSACNSADVHRELMRQRRKPHQTLLEYYYAMLAIGRRGNVDEKAIVSYVIVGINDPGLVKSLLAQNIQTCVGLVAALENLTWSLASAQRAGIVNCPQPQRKQCCEKCNKIGHSANACRSEKNTVAKVGSTESRSFPSGHPPPVMETIIIWGRQFKAFIDTGSDSSLTAENQVPDGVIRKSMTRRLEGFGGAVIQVEQSVEAEIVIEEVHINVELMLVPAAVMQHELLIGRDIIFQAGCKLVINSGVSRVCVIEEERFNINQEIEATDRQRIKNLLEPPFKGPYIITKSLDYDRYIVEEGWWHYSSIHSVDHLKPWCSLSLKLDDDGG